MLKINPHQMRQPIGGHHFTTDSQTFRGETFESVVKQLTMFRIINNQPLGDPEQDILLYYASNWPYMVMTRGDSVPLNQEIPNANYIGWRSWIYKVWRSPMPKLLSEREAGERWNKCQNCPFNKKKDWPVSDESKELDRRAFILRRGTRAPGFVGYCSLHRVDLSAFTFSETPRSFSSKPKDTEDYSGCWV